MRQSLIAFLNNLIEEGVAKITTYAIIWDKDVKANIITAVTDEATNDARHDWAKWVSCQDSSFSPTLIILRR